MSQYTKGADFERRIRRRLESEGYTVIRSAGSKTVVDLVAFKPPGKPLFIQAKSGKTGISRAERIRLVDAADDCAATAVLVTRGLRFEFLGAAA